VIDRFGGLDLVKVGQTIFAKKEVGLAFFVKWEDCKEVILPGRHCIQIAGWRRTAPPGMPRYTFYRHVLPIRGTVVADAKQMIDGERFWGDQVYEALEHGLYVYRVNLVQQLCSPIRSIKEYL